MSSFQSHSDDSVTGDLNKESPADMTHTSQCVYFEKNMMHVHSPKVTLSSDSGHNSHKNSLSFN